MTAPEARGAAAMRAALAIRAGRIVLMRATVGAGLSPLRSAPDGA